MTDIGRALRAENERLRDERDVFDDQAQEMCAKLDAAADLRERAGAANRSLVRKLDAAESRLATATELLRECDPIPSRAKWYDEKDAFLANQPAKPDPLECQECGGWPRNDHHCQPAAPARTETEQRVLEAMSSANKDDLRDDLHGGDRWRKRVAEAELARRKAEK